MPKGARSVTRGTPWGNPYRVGWGGDPLGLFRSYAERRLEADSSWLDPLVRCSALACWCKPEAKCHADILVELVTRRRLELLGKTS